MSKCLKNILKVPIFLGKNTSKIPIFLCPNVSKISIFFGQNVPRIRFSKKHFRKFGSSYVKIFQKLIPIFLTQNSKKPNFLGQNI